MSFLSLVLALAIQQVLSPGNALQSRAWVVQLDNFLARQIAGPWLRIPLLLSTLVLAGHWLLRELSDWAFALPALLASTVMFLWSLGGRDYHTALERFEARVASDPTGAAATTADLWMPVAKRPPGDGSAADGAEVDANGGDALELSRQRLLYAGFSRWFAPLFYFLLAGPLAAVVYRTTAVLAAEEREPLYLRLLTLLDWVPSRLLCLSFALAGDFLAVVQRARDPDLAVGGEASQWLRACASAACGRADDARAAADLLYRCAGLWLLLISLTFFLI